MPDAPLWSRILPLAVLLYFWPVCLGGKELARRREWPLLFRYSLETAAVFLVLALGYASVVRDSMPGSGAS